MATATVFITSGTSYTIPVDYGTLVSVQVLGGGGGGDSGTNTDGGGGGAYSKITSDTLSPGQNITIQVGAGGNNTGSDGTDTWWHGASLGASTCGAKGGQGGTGGGAGGASGSGVGSTKFSGGNGGAGNIDGGGGGSSASPTANGGNGGTTDGAGGGGGGGASAPATNGSDSVGGARGTGAFIGGSSSGGGGGSSAASVPAQDGSSGTEFDGSHGSGGGGGGGGGFGNNGGNGAAYGGGGGGALVATGVGGTGGAGLIVFIYNISVYNPSRTKLNANTNVATHQPIAWAYEFTGSQQPYQGRKLAPSISAVQVDSPPPQHPGRTPAQTSIALIPWQPEAWPPVFAGGRQPYASAKLTPSIIFVPQDNPPFGIPPKWLSVVNQAWQPEVWPYVFMGNLQPYEVGKLPPPQTAVQEDNPPFRLPERAPGAMVVKWAWQPEVWPYTFMGQQQPYEMGRLPPSLTDVPVNNPPFQHPERWAGLNAIKQGWQPDPWPPIYMGGSGPYLSIRLNPSIHGIARNDPPFQYVGRWVGYPSIEAQWLPPDWPFVFMGGRQAYEPAKLNPSLTAVPENNPPFRYPGLTPAQVAIVITQWQPDPWPAVFMGGRQAYTPRLLPASQTAVPEDNPPFRHPERWAGISAIKIPWQPDPWPVVFVGGKQAYEGRKLAPGIPGQSGDNPPFQHPGRTPQTSLLVTVWQPDPWVYAFAGGRQPYGGRKLTPGTPGVSVDNPPFRHPSRLVQTVTEIMSWQPDPWPSVFMGGWGPYAPRHLPPAITNVNPPINQTIRNVIVRCRFVSG